MFSGTKLRKISHFAKVVFFPPHSHFPEKLYCLWDLKQKLEIWQWDNPGVMRETFVFHVKNLPRFAQVLSFFFYKLRSAY